MLIIGCSAIDRCIIRRALVLQSNVAKGRRFQLVLIKPSHYDDDGYVIRWWRAMTPSNSLAAVYGIVRASKGFIDVTSSPGAGSTFTMRVPCAGPEPTRGVPEGTAA